MWTVIYVIFYQFVSFNPMWWICHPLWLMFFKYMKKNTTKKGLSLKGKIRVLPTQFTLLQPRSRCMSCKYELLRWEIHEEYRKYGVPPISLGLPTSSGSRMSVGGCWVQRNLLWDLFTSTPTIAGCMFLLLVCFSGGHKGMIPWCFNRCWIRQLPELYMSLTKSWASTKWPKWHRLIYASLASLI